MIFNLFFAILRVADQRMLVELPYVTDAETAIRAVKRYTLRGVALRGCVVRHTFRRNRLSSAKVVKIDSTILTEADVEAAPHWPHLFVDHTY